MDLTICRVFLLREILQYRFIYATVTAMNENKHFMILDFHGNPGLNDPRSDYRLSLEQLRSTLTRVNVFSDMNLPHRMTRKGIAAFVSHLTVVRAWICRAVCSVLLISCLIIRRVCARKIRSSKSCSHLTFLIHKYDTYALRAFGGLCLDGGLMGSIRRSF